ncbi:MAG: alpha/beta hydrolase [Balneolaceae bacterium]|nr:alpha/beta hydrolase [Balneolaceae bacterium]
MNNTPLILLHGALGSAQQLEPLQSKLEKHFEVHTLSFTGHGGTTPIPSFSIDLFSRDVIAYMNAHAISEAHIFGYSMGGYVALNLACQHPRLVTRVITLGTKIDWHPEFAAREIKLLNSNKIEQKVPVFAKHLKAVHHPADWKKVVAHTADMLEELGQNKILTKEKLKSIKQPVLIGIGLKDDTVTVDESEWASEQLPNGTLKKFPEFYHPINKIDVDKLSEYIIGFLKQNLPH